MWKKALDWILGAFEDKEHSCSSKRIGFYVLLWILNNVVKGELEGKHIDPNLLYVIMVLILFTVGAITSEFFSKIQFPTSTTTIKQTSEITNTESPKPTE